MAVVQEIAAQVLELDPHPLPAIVLVIDAAFGLAVRVNALEGLHDQSQLRTHHPEQANHALLIGRCATQSSEADRGTKNSPRPFGPLRGTPQPFGRGRRRYDAVVRLERTEWQQGRLGVVLLQPLEVTLHRAPSAAEASRQSAR